MNLLFQSVVDGPLAPSLDQEQRRIESETQGNLCWHTQNPNSTKQCKYTLPNCSAYGVRSVISLSAEDRGLCDRIATFSAWSLVAKALCAELVIPKPYLMLTAKHSAGHALKANFHWDHYVDASDSLIRQSFSVDAPPAGKITGWTVDAEFHGGYDDSIVERAPALLHQGHSFAWQVSPPRQSYTIDWFERGSCVDWVTFGPSPLVVDLTNRFLSCSGLDGGARYHTLHVRRTDRQHQCDTSAPAVNVYVESCLPADPSSPLVVFTDEKDGEYLNALLASLAAKRRKVVFGDPLVKEIGANFTEGLDNYLDFAVAKHIIGLSVLRVEARGPDRCMKECSYR